MKNKRVYELFTIVRIHLAHSSLRTFRPFCRTETRWRLGRKVRFVARWEKLRLWPKVVVFPHISHFAIFRILSLQNYSTNAKLGWHALNRNWSIPQYVSEFKKIGYNIDKGLVL
jgi:hypothetical protein